MAKCYQFTDSKSEAKITSSMFCFKDIFMGLNYLWEHLAEDKKKQHSFTQTQKLVFAMTFSQSPQQSLSSAAKS